MSTNKIEMLKSTITHLYSKEGRSIGYISRLLEIDAKELSSAINQWNLREAKPLRHLKPSEQKYVNRNRKFIKDRLDSSISVAKIAKELGQSETFISDIIKKDDVLNNAMKQHNRRNEVKTNRNKKGQKVKNLHGEQWKNILGYSSYMVSNMGRVKIKKTNTLVEPLTNDEKHCQYVTLRGDNGKTKTLQLMRLVAFAFVDGYDDKHTRLYCKDNDMMNAKANNLRWVDEFPAYRLPRGLTFKTIVYKEKYQFKTVAALARFTNRDINEVAAWFRKPEAHAIKLI